MDGNDAKKIIAGNWKMNKTKKEADSFIDEMKDKVRNNKAEAIVCAPVFFLAILMKSTEGNRYKNWRTNDAL